MPRQFAPRSPPAQRDPAFCQSIPAFGASCAVPATVPLMPIPLSNLATPSLRFLALTPEEGKGGIMGRTIGIDLGTTNSCMAFVDEQGEANVIINAGGRTHHAVRGGAD